MDARGILEIAKAAGQADIAPGCKVFTGWYFTKGRIIDLDSTHRVEIAKDGIFRDPFVFVAANEVSGGEPDIAPCKNEENALVAIQTILNERSIDGTDQ
jgi:hypothetical protein